MSHYYCKDVKKFHDKFGLVTPPVFQLVPKDLHEFRLKFFNEEFTEYYDAYKDHDLAGAIDALIDLVYITSGAALLYGIDPDQFVNNAATLQSEDIYQIASLDSLCSYPHLLDEAETRDLTGCLATNIKSYEIAYQNKDASAIAKSFAEIYVNCLFGASHMGFTEDMWNELWDDVQKCNLSKVRATKSSDSKRGSTFDVVKPAGWKPPRTEELVQKFISSAS